MNARTGYPMEKQEWIKYHKIAFQIQKEHKMFFLKMYLYFKQYIKSIVYTILYDYTSHKKVNIFIFLKIVFEVHETRTKQHFIFQIFIYYM